MVIHMTYEAEFHKLLICMSIPKHTRPQRHSQGKGELFSYETSMFPSLPTSQI